VVEGGGGGGGGGGGRGGGGGGGGGGWGGGGVGGLGGFCWACFGFFLCGGWFLEFFFFFFFSLSPSSYLDLERASIDGPRALLVAALRGAHIRPLIAVRASHGVRTSWRCRSRLVRKNILMSKAEPRPVNLLVLRPRHARANCARVFRTDRRPARSFARRHPSKAWTEQSPSLDGGVDEVRPGPAPLARALAPTRWSCGGHLLAGVGRSP